jgi:hypothetical protein
MVVFVNTKHCRLEANTTQYQNRTGKNLFFLAEKQTHTLILPNIIIGMEVLLRGKPEFITNR